MPQSPARPSPNPFPGLRPFGADEDYLFFGRDGQSDELLHRLRINRFLAVVGTSGSGKSSLVRAGLLPALHGGFMAGAGSNWRVTIFRPGDDPIGQLAAALHAPDVLAAAGDAAQVAARVADTEATLRRSAFGLVDTIRQARLSAHENLLIIVDQFEELFRFKRAEERGQANEEAAAFVKLLLEATGQTEVPIYIVITMRSDFLGDCAQFRRLPEAINDGQYLIPRMTRDQRREAVIGPVAVGGAQMTPRLVNCLLNDVGDNPDQLPIMQHALARTWQRWAQERNCTAPLDLPHYEAIGGMAEALSRHADKAYNELPDARSQEVAKRLFQCLTETSQDYREVRRPTKVQDICVVAQATEAEVGQVIESFRRPGRSFLMPPPDTPLTADTLVDISHESLIRGWQRLHEWVEEEARSARIYRRLAETAVLHRECNANLWHDPDLQIALSWRAHYQPTEAWARRYHPEFKTAMDFLDKSREANAAEKREREQQRVRNLRRTQLFAGILGLAALLSVGMALLAVSERNVAVAQTEVAQKQAADLLTANVQTNVALFAAKQAKEQAEAAKQRAEDAEQVALQQQQQAEEAEQSAQANARRAEQALIEAKRQQQRAEQQTKVAGLRLKAFENALSSFMRTRGQYLDNLNGMIGLADRLIEVSPPRGALTWRLFKAGALSSAGRHDAAAEEYSQILEMQSDQPSALLGRGYLYSVSGDKEKTLQSINDLNNYLKLDPSSALAYQNLAISFGILGRYDEAAATLDKGIGSFEPGRYGTLSDSKVDPKIQDTTGIKELVINDNEFQTALYYQQASLQAYTGNAQRFAALLAEADKHAPSVEAYLAGINWAWLHLVNRPEDYGALASQGILWERAGYQDEAVQCYGEFKRRYATLPDARYRNLAQWVDHQLHRLGSTNFGPLIALGRNDNEKTGAQATGKTTQASVKHSTRPGSISEAERQRLAMERAEQRMRPEAIDENSLAAKNDPAAEPPPLNESTREAQLRQGLAYRPTRVDTMLSLSELVAKHNPEEALQLLERAIAIWPHDPNLYYRKAYLQSKTKRADGGLKAIEMAIALKSGELSFYDMRAEIEQQLGKNPTEIVRVHSEGYNQAGDTLFRLDQVDAALDAYVKSLKLLTKYIGDHDDTNVRRDIFTTVHKLARVVELRESKAKAIEYLRTKFADEKGLEEALKNEIQCLSPRP